MIHYFVITISLFFPPLEGNALQSPTKTITIIATDLSCDQVIEKYGERWMRESISRTGTPSPEQISHSTIQCRPVADRELEDKRFVR